MNILKLIGDFNIKHANSRNAKTASRGINPVLDDKTDFLVREAYNAARTNIIYSIGSEKGCKKIIITSASPHEGKTTTSLNVAITFAQTEAKVLIIDADLRKPRINRHLGLPREDGLSDLLCGLIDIDKAIKHSDKYNLDCITSGHIPPNPTELLTSSEMGNVLEKLGERYDYIFIDTPPVTVVTEAAAMAKYVSGVIFVVRQNSTIYESINRARNSFQLANAKILGYVLNDVSATAYKYGGYNRYGSSKRGYGYGHKYGYGYGYGYSDNEKEKKEKKQTPEKKKK
ncbi:MAG: CpsD/CapB family tyrosine-protein kinase [Clostridia bacterium]|nr:CpsD/CapB family tyrosine-protein kinase [Clostridia bacterium]